MDWLNRCHFGDVRDILRRMAADGVKVNTIVTSPPYWGLRSYLPEGHPDKVHEIGSEKTFAEFLTTMVEVFDLCREVLADDGTMWVNMGDSYAANRTYQVPSTKGGPKHSDSQSAGGRGSAVPSGLKPKDLVGQPWRLAFALQESGWYLRQDIIWSKPNPMPESVRDRCTKAHEYIFLLSKSERYYFDQASILEPASPNTHARLAQDVAAQVGSSRGYTGADEQRPMKAVARGHNTRPPAAVGRRDGPPGNPPERKLAEVGSGTKNNDSMDAALAVMPTSRNKRSVWTVGSEPYSGAHFATFPTKLIEPCILAGCPEGGVVLDIFFGSGTTGQVAQDLGRNWIGIDLNPANKPLQDRRLASPDQRRRQRALLLEAA